ncbi:hypothetical protein BDW75DRAFT_240538 [Aspergillus navahoensis]
MKFLASFVSLAALATLAAASPSPQGAGPTAKPNYGGDSQVLTNDGSCTTLSDGVPIRSVRISGSVQGCGLFSDEDCSDRDSVVFSSRASVSGDSVAIGCQ